jgi:SAM-dependent methyltransferase
LGKLFPPRVEVAELGRLPLGRKSRVLDVGCGRGQLLSVLYRAGFAHLLGVDPYLPADVEVAPGLWVRRKAIEAVEEQFDVIMLHHVFEHIADGAAMLRTCRQHLTEGGKILLRIPVAECYAWERYRENWVALDAPRHYFLHTRGSLKLLACSAGLEVVDCWCDSNEFQFWASELYVRGVPLMDAEGRTALPEEHFTVEQLRRFRKDAREANAANRGDQAAFVLVPARSP